MRIAFGPCVRHSQSAVSIGTTSSIARRWRTMFMQPTLTRRCAACSRARHVDALASACGGYSISPLACLYATLPIATVLSPTLSATLQATGNQIIQVSRIMIVVYGILMVCCAAAAFEGFFRPACSTRTSLCMPSAKRGRPAFAVWSPGCRAKKFANCVSDTQGVFSIVLFEIGLNLGWVYLFMVRAFRTQPQRGLAGASCLQICAAALRAVRQRGSRASTHGHVGLTLARSD